MDHFKNNYTTIHNDNMKIYNDASEVCKKYFERVKKEKDDKKTCEYKAYSELKSCLKPCDNIVNEVTHIYDTTNYHTLTIDHLKTIFYFYYNLDHVKENLTWIKSLENKKNI